MKKIFLLVIFPFFCYSCVSNDNYKNGDVSTPSSRINQIQTGADSILKDLDE